MEKLSRAFIFLSQYFILLVLTLGYWLEMAEELEADNHAARLGKGLLVVVKLLVYPR